MNGYTSGPWHTTPGHHETNIYIKTNDLTLVATVLGKETDLERDTNARLIAAAPELFERLRDTTDALEALTKDCAALGMEQDTLFDLSLEIVKAREALNAVEGVAG